MGRIVRACAGILAVITATLAMLAGTATAAAGSCEQKVLLDWSDNGRVDGMYPLRCYDGALTSMPSDLRDYTNASDAIQRALARATTRSASAGDEPGRVAAGTGMQLGGPGPSEVPLPLIVLAGVSLLVLAAGSLGWIARRRRGRSIA
jgi:hypothetical protein